MEGHEASAFLIVENFGNLIKDEWGVMYETGFPRAQEVVSGSINDNGQFVYNELLNQLNKPVLLMPRFGKSVLVFVTALRRELSAPMGRVNATH